MSYSGVDRFALTVGILDQGNTPVRPVKPSFTIQPASPNASNDTSILIFAPTVDFGKWATPRSLRTLRRYLFGRSSQENETRLHLRGVHGDHLWNTRLLRTIPGTPHPPRSQSRTAPPVLEGEFASIDLGTCTRNDLLAMSEHVRPQVWAEMHRRHKLLLGGDPVLLTKSYPDPPPAFDHQPHPHPQKSSAASITQSDSCLELSLDLGAPLESILEGSLDQHNHYHVSSPQPATPSSPRNTNSSVMTGHSPHPQELSHYHEDYFGGSFTGPSFHSGIMFEPRLPTSTSDPVYGSSQNPTAYSGEISSCLSLGWVGATDVNRSLLQAGIPGALWPPPLTTLNTGLEDTTGTCGPYIQGDPGAQDL